MTAVSRVLAETRRWSMVEVFVLATVVCMHRLEQIADLEVGTGFWAIGAVMLLFAMADSIFDVRDLWAQPGVRDTKAGGASPEPSRNGSLAPTVPGRTA